MKHVDHVGPITPVSRASRQMSRAALLASAVAASVGCASADRAPQEEVGTTRGAIVDVVQTPVKKQSIGNCWIYAVASWAESLAKSASGTDVDMSESYWTYWHWFDQIANSSRSKISTGGSYSTAVDLISRYGIMSEEAFIASESHEELSARQASALEKINESLATGALSTPQARHNRALVRQELDAAWELEPTVSAQLDQVFGAGVTRTLDTSTVATTGTAIQRASQIPVALRDPTTKATSTQTLQDAIGARTGWGDRTGRFAWRTVPYPWSASTRRAVLARVQRAMHDRQPVIISWYVDFNALDTAKGTFAAPPETPGRQGGHMVVVEDYQVNDVPGFGTLSAGQLETRPEALEAALDPSAKVEFFRIKNSWGSLRASAFQGGYYDLYMTYLDGPIRRCSTDEDDNPNLDDCSDTTPLNTFWLPAGY